MSQQYDKILKENIEEVFLPLAEKYLGISILSSRKLPGKIQSTIEREPDFIRIVKTKDQQEFILQIEFQTTDQKDMIYRMVEYHALLLKKYRYPVKQFVVYLGQATPKMRTQLREDEVMKGFGLINLQALGYQKLLHSQIPEEIILAILSKHEVDVEKLIDTIIKRLKAMSNSEIALQKYIRQLTILSRLRNLEEIVTKKVKEMPITYDIKKDYLYQEGLKEGEKKGEKKGVEEGKKVMIIEMLKDKSLSVEKIAKFAQVSVDYVKELQHSLNL